MTRKRFIKLLMSFGFDRNEAATAANLELAQGVPYAKALRKYKAVKHFPEAMSAFAQALRTLSDRMLEWSIALSAFSSKMEAPHDDQSG